MAQRESHQRRDEPAATWGNPHLTGCFGSPTIWSVGLAVEMLYGTEAVT